MYLGIDVGTSGVKVAMIAENGALVAQATAPLAVSRPHGGWSEQSPEDWWTSTEAALLSLPADLRAKVEAIGLAGQMHGAVLLGPDDRSLRPAILWDDGRSEAQCRVLEQMEPRSRTITGNLAMPGFAAPKLLWVRDHEPRIFAEISSVLLPKDYVRLRMTGDKATDMADAAGTLWLDVGKRRWSPAMLAACALSEAHMPRLFEGSEISGALRPEIARRWGMGRVPVAAGGGDNAAGAIGVGVVNEGDALLSLGTSGVIFVATSAFRPRPARGVHAFCHAVPGMWHQMAVHLSAASCVEWAARLTGVAGPGELLARAEATGVAAGPELFLPYLAGERTPHNDPHVRGVLLGLSHGSDGGRIAAAILEGVAFAHADGIAALRDAGTKVDSLILIGGGARSRHWSAILAAALDVRTIHIEGGEVGPALGAAKLAQIAVTGAEPAMVSRRPPVSHVVEPDPLLAERLAPKLRRFRAAYPLIRQIEE